MIGWEWWWGFRHVVADDFYHHKMVSTAPWLSWLLAMVIASDGGYGTVKLGQAH